MDKVIITLNSENVFNKLTCVIILSGGFSIKGSLHSLWIAADFILMYPIIRLKCQYPDSMYRIDYCQGLCGPFPNYRADSWTIARFVLSLVNGTLQIYYKLRITTLSVTIELSIHGNLPGCYLHQYLIYNCRNMNIRCIRNLTSGKKAVLRPTNGLCSSCDLLLF